MTTLLFDGNHLFHRDLAVRARNYLTTGQDLNAGLADPSQRVTLLRKCTIDLCSIVRLFGGDGGEVGRVLVIIDSRSWHHNFVTDYKRCLTGDHQPLTTSRSSRLSTPGQPHSNGQAYPLVALRRDRNAGYKISLFYFGLATIDDCIYRVMQRKQSGGHDVTNGIIGQNFTVGIEMMQRSLHLFDNITFIDGNSDFGEIVAIYIKRSGKHEVTDHRFEWFDKYFAKPFDKLNPANQTHLQSHFVPSQIPNFFVCKGFGNTKLEILDLQHVCSPTRSPTSGISEEANPQKCDFISIEFPHPSC